VIGPVFLDPARRVCAYSGQRFEVGPAGGIKIDGVLAIFVMQPCTDAFRDILRCARCLRGSDFGLRGGFLGLYFSAFRGFLRLPLDLLVRFMGARRHPQQGGTQRQAG
jgi:hypothetical protein